MSTLLEPPPLLALAVLIVAAVAALWVVTRGVPGARAAEAGAAGVSEEDEMWGAPDPAPPEKQPYVYLADRPPPEPELDDAPTDTLLVDAEAANGADLLSAGDDLMADDDDAEDEDAPSLAELYRRRARAETPAAVPAGEPADDAPGNAPDDASGGTAVDRTAGEER